MAEWFECDCGTARKLPAKVLALIADLGRDIRLEVSGRGTWLVPRVFIAAHGIKAGEVPALPEEHGWKRIDGEAATAAREEK